MSTMKPDIPIGEQKSRRFWLPELNTILICIIDLALLNCALFLAFHLRFQIEWGVGSKWIPSVPLPPFKEYALGILFLNYLFITLSSLFKLYRRERSRWLIDELHGIIKTLTLNFLFATSTTFFARIEGFQYSRIVLFYSYLMALCFLGAWRFLLLKIEHWIHNRGWRSRIVLIAGSGDMAHIVVRKLKDHPELGYRIKGFTAALSENLKDLDGYPYLGEISRFESIMLENNVDEVFICDPEISHFKLLEMVSICEAYKIAVKMVPTVYDLLIDFADMSDLDGLPLVAVREQPMYEFSLLLKRCFDFVFSIIVLLLTLPLSLLIVVAIKLDSIGPVCFVQTRAGVGGKPFRMLKFRTMLFDAEAQLGSLIDIDQLEEPVFKIENDPRVTRVGRWLRRSSLDEIPQFWNVLIGHMSVVGPRPEETQLVDKYNIWQRRRLKIKPGITGMQQIMCRGTTSLSDRIKYDIYYLRKHSLLLDIWIILKTIPVVFSGRGAS